MLLIFKPFLGSSFQKSNTDCDATSHLPSCKIPRQLSSAQMREENAKQSAQGTSNAFYSIENNFSILLPEEKNLDWSSVVCNCCWSQGPGRSEHTSCTSTVPALLCRSGSSGGTPHVCHQSVIWPPRLAWLGQAGSKPSCLSPHTDFLALSALKHHRFRKLLKECASNPSMQWLLWSQIQENRFLKIIKTAGKYNQLLMPLSEMAVLQITGNPN